LRGALTAVQCPPVERFTVGLLRRRAESFEHDIRDVPSGRAKADRGSDCVYVISVSSGFGDAVGRLVTKLETARGKKIDDYCQVNGHHQGTRTLYVGRSKTL